jgi:molecular chaperone GrpE
VNNNAPEFEPDQEANAAGSSGVNDQAHADALDSVLESSDPPRPETTGEAVERMKREVEQAHQRVLMAQAEMENFRKRTRKDYEDQLRFAALPLVEDLLQVRDNLIRALDAAAVDSATIDGLRAGVGMVAKQWDDILAKHGIRPIVSVGESFDPNFHQAIAQAPNDTHPAGVVAVEATTGFQMHGRVVRPSQVIVSTGKPQG